MSDGGGFDSPAAERSAVYRALAQAFTYEGAQTSAFGIGGAEYNAAFDPSVSERACSLRWRAHTQEDQGALFEELARFYGFFGLKRAEGAEMPDHLSVELEFMQFLTHLEDRAAQRPDELAGLRRAQRDFLRRHPWRLVQAVRQGIGGSDASCVALVETAYAFLVGEIALVERGAGPAADGAMASGG